MFSVVLLHANHIYNVCWCRQCSRNNLVYRLRGSIRIHLSQCDMQGDTCLPGITSTTSITGHCCSSVHCFLKKLQLRFCNGLVLGCSSGGFLKAIQLERLILSSYWHNWELKKKRKPFYTKTVYIEKKTTTKKIITLKAIKQL